jgi:hypothetical protein
MAALLMGRADVCGAESRGALVSIQLKAGPETVPLDSSSITIVGPGGVPKPTPAVLEHRTYQVDAVDLAGGRRRTYRLECYELRAIAPDRHFEWAVCSHLDLGMFRLLSKEDGQHYLAWVEGVNVFFSEMREQRDRVGGVCQYVRTLGATPDDAVLVPTGQLIDQQEWRPGDRPVSTLFSELTVDDISLGEGGSVTVKISGPRPGSPSRQAKHFTLVFDGKEWRREE